VFPIVVQINHNNSNYSAMLSLMNSLQYKKPLGNFDDKRPIGNILLFFAV